MQQGYTKLAKNFFRCFTIDMITGISNYNYNYNYNYNKFSFGRIIMTYFIFVVVAFVVVCYLLGNHESNLFNRHDYEKFYKF